MKSTIQNLLTLASDLNTDKFGMSQMIRQLSPGEDAQLVNASLREGLAGLLYKNLLKFELIDRLDSDSQEKLRSNYYRTVYFNLKLIHDLKEILLPLNQNQIQVVLVQGIELLQGIYSDIGLRSLSDIDLWVLKKYFGKLVPILTNLGYRRDPLYPHTFRKGGTVLDIHTHILWADRIRSREMLLANSQNFIYQKTRFITVEGQQARSLGKYDQVLYLGLHLLKHNVDRLIWLVDIKNLVADWKFSDWQSLLMRARELGQEKCVAQTFFLIGSLLEFQMPEEIYAKLVPLNPIEKKLLRLRQKKGSLPEWSTLILFSSGKRPFKAMLFILETLFPRPDILRQVFAETPGLSAPQLYTRRFFQLIKMLKPSLK